MRPSPQSISRPQFAALLSEYPALIASLSASKPPKPGKESLAQLDAFRYGEALDVFAPTSARQVMTLAHLERLVEWKLRHGKFRPTLLALVSSNPASTVSSTIQTALRTYCPTRDSRAEALKTLCTLRGIGPATASLLLAVHDHAHTIFFSDEAFAWLCGGSAASPKYSAAEYAALADAADSLVARLGVDAVDVEKVAFVIVRSPPAPLDHDQDSHQSKSDTKSHSLDSTPKAGASRRPKRKPPPSGGSPPPSGSSQTGLRRSKRLNM